MHDDLLTPPTTRDLVVFESAFVRGEPITHATLDGKTTLCGRSGWETSEGWSDIGPDCLRCSRALAQRTERMRALARRDLDGAPLHAVLAIIDARVMGVPEHQDDVRVLLDWIEVADGHHPSWPAASSLAIGLGLIHDDGARERATP